MELLQLRYFCDAAVSENFSHTAHKFGVPPSNISQSVKRLERELGVTLFQRRANSIILNERGRAFYVKASRALAILADAAADATDEETHGKIRICINSNRRIVMKTVENYRRSYPDVEIVTTHFTNPLSEEFDMIIDSNTDALKEYDKQLLISEKILIAISKMSSLFGLKRLTVADLRDEAFVTMSEKSSLYHLTSAICRESGFAPKIAMQSDDPFYVRKCVELGLGVCFVPSFSWQGQFSEGVQLLDCGDYKRNTYIFTDPKRHIPLCVRRFIEMLIAAVRT